MKHLKKFNEATGLRNDQPINTGDYLLIVDDSVIKEGDWVLNKGNKLPAEVLFIKDRGDGKFICGLKSINIDDNYSDLLSSCKKIIKHLPLNGSSILDGVDLLPSTNESKNASELLTAEEFYQQAMDDITIGDDITDLMNAYAKMHVTAALKAALNNVEYADGNHSAVDDIDEESILNSYPLDNIK